MTVKLGALCHISPAHFRTHFVQGTHGTVAQGAQLRLEVLRRFLKMNLPLVLLPPWRGKVGMGGTG